MFWHIDGATIETNAKDARESNENISLNPDETIVSLDVKGLYRFILLWNN